VRKNTSRRDVARKGNWNGTDCKVEFGMELSKDLTMCLLIYSSFEKINRAQVDGMWTPHRMGCETTD
jgi:hypothetical protein